MKIGEESGLWFKQAYKYILFYVQEPGVTIVAWLAIANEK